SWLAVDHEGALPVRNGELVHLEVRLNQPGFVYLLWIDSQGVVQPLYPWDIANSKEGWSAPWVPSGEQPHTEFHCPSEKNRGLEVEGPVGLETVVLLARTTPLPRSLDLQKLVGRLPASASTNSREVVWLGQMPGELTARHERILHRSVTAGRSKEIDTPVFELLEARLRPHFDLMKAVRFAHGE